MNFTSIKWYRKGDLNPHPTKGLDPESNASTNSAIPAKRMNYKIISNILNLI